MLSEKQIEGLKKQLLTQIENFPEEQKQVAKKQIEEMGANQLEEFLKQNNLVKEGEDQGTTQCIFCMINQGKVPSVKIAETDTAIAILEINPISEAHAIIIPRIHTKSETISKNELEFAKQIADKIKLNFKPKKVDILPSELFGHSIINILPVYKDETLNSPRKKAEEKNLEMIKEKLLKKPIEVVTPAGVPTKEGKEKPKPVRKETPAEKEKREAEELKKLPKAPRRQP